MPHTLPTTARLEAFSDGVIAVIITIMVLELKVPREDGPASLRAILPTLLVYLLSFTFTGVYWINHHYLVHRIQAVNPLILYTNLAFLFCLSLMPFFTAFVIEKKLDSFAVALYAVSMLVIGFAFLLLRLAIGQQVRRSGASDRENRAEQRKHLASLALYAVAIPLAHSHPKLALLTTAAVTLVWILPSLAAPRIAE